MKWLIASLGILFILLVPEAAFAASATLALSPSTGTLNTGCTYSIDIMLNTDNANTDGTDVILKYDQTRISPTASPITVGTLYPDYPAKDFQNGQISISGLESPGQTYNSKGVAAKFATINISIPQSAPTGALQLTFDFEGPGVTTDSNVVQTGTVTDILSSVVNGSYVIANGTDCTAITDAGAGGTATNSASLGGVGGDNFGTSSGITQTKLPNSANVTPTIVLTALGGFLVLIGAGGLIALRK